MFIACHVNKRVLILFIAIIFHSTLACDDSFLDKTTDQWYFLYDTASAVSNTDIYFPLTDTGLETSYSDYDDGYYSVPAQMSLTVINTSNGADIVKDNVTGLMWTKCTMNRSGGFPTDDGCNGLPETYSWVDSDIKCRRLEWAGYSDWRLPTIHELMSLMNFNSDFRIDKTFFPDNQSTYWSKTQYGTSYARSISFENGAIMTNTASYTKVTEKKFVRCVRNE